MKNESMAYKVNLLCVDDVEANLLALSEVLRSETVMVLLARSGPDALELLLKHDVALAIIDVQMPDMDGYQLAEMMRGVQRTRHVPIVFVTAGAQDRARRFRGYEAGGVDFLYKPIEPEILRSKADTFITLHRQRLELMAQGDELRLLLDEKTRVLEKYQETEQALRESEQRYRNLVSMMPAAMYTCDRQGRITFYNENALALWGREPKIGDEDEKFCGSFKLFLPNGSPLPHSQTPMVDAISHGTRYRNQEVVIERPDGTRIDVLVNIDPIRDSDGTLSGAVNIFTDITERKRAEEAVRESQQDLSTAQAVAHVGSWRLNVLHNQLTWSDESYRIAGIPRGTPLTYESFLAIVHPDDRGYVDRKWKAALRGEPYDIEHRFEVGGEIRWAREQARLEFDDRGELVGGFGTFHDITEQKRIDVALRNRADQFETLLNQAPLGVYLVDADFRIAQVNPVARPMFGDIPDLIGQDFDDVIHSLWEKRYADEVVAIFRHTLETGEPYMTPERAEFRIDRGVTEYYEWRLDRITLPDGSYGLVCYFRDISTQVQARERIRESEARFRTMADVSPVIIWVTDATGGIEFTNQAYRDFCGVTDDDVRERRWQMVVHPDDQEEYVAEFLRCVREKQPFYGRCRLKRADGQWRWIASYGAPRFSEDGQFLGHVGSSPDVQDLQEAQERLHQWNIELEEAVNSKTVELLQSQEHLRALATELNLAEQRERKRLAAELHDHLQQLLVLGKMQIGQGRRFALGVPAWENVMKQVDGIFSEALTYTRTLVSELSPHVLRDHGLAAGLQWLGEYMKKHDLAVTVTVPDKEDITLPEEQLVLLFQSVRELLMNSWKHGGTGHASVSLKRSEGRLQIEVRDEGRGFDLAAAAPGSTSTGGSSSKFGLFSIRERMRAVGGSFAIQSEPGKGTLATLAVSVKRGEASPSAPEEIPALPVEAPPRCDRRRERCTRILLVDDHAMVRQGLRSILTGYSDVEVVAEAGTGVEALSAVEAHRPDVVVMDINMPTMDGIEATRRIKGLYPDISVIGLSVNTGNENRQAMLQAGAAVLLTKESAVEQLYNAIQGDCGAPGIERNEMSIPSSLHPNEIAKPVPLLQAD